MEEQKLKKPMNEEEFREFIHNKIDEDFQNGIIHLHTFEAVNKYKSVRRAMRRGLVSPYGEIYPKRPFNNRGNHRRMNDLKKEIYGQLNYRSQKD